MGKTSEISIPIIKGDKDICRLIFQCGEAGKYDIKINFLENPFEVWTYRLFSWSPIIWNVEHPQHIEASYHRGRDGWPITIHLKDTKKTGADAYRTLPPTRILPPNINQRFPMPLFKLEIPQSVLGDAKSYKEKKYHTPVKAKDANVLEFYMASHAFDTNDFCSPKYGAICEPQLLLSIEYFASYTVLTDYEKNNHFFPKNHQSVERMQVLTGLSNMQLLAMEYTVPEIDQYWDKVHVTFIENELAEDILLCTRMAHPKIPNPFTGYYDRTYLGSASLDQLKYPSGPWSKIPVLPSSTVEHALLSNEFTPDERNQLEQRAGNARARLYSEMRSFDCNIAEQKRALEGKAKKFLQAVDSYRKEIWAGCEKKDGIAYIDDAQRIILSHNSQISQELHMLFAKWIGLESYELCKLTIQSKKYTPPKKTKAKIYDDNGIELQINEEKYNLIRNGIPVPFKRPDGKPDKKYAVVIDFQHPENNRFLAIKELKIHGDLYRRRTDIVGFVNGIPLLFVELKATTVDVQNAYTDNYTDHLDTIPQLFYYNAFLILSNGVEAKVDTLGSKYEFFHEWKRLNEKDFGSVALETMLRGICKKENFLDLLENFILFDHSDRHTAKILARNHQYLGVNEAVKAYAERKLRDGKLGVFWHTQGSGKSYSMVFLAQKIRRKSAGSPTIVILTDRDELNKQISDTFENCGLLGKTKARQFIAQSGDDLIDKLRGNPSFIFTLIQKFNQPDAAPIYPDHDIIIMSDEAHRSQYGIFADNMVALLPTASRIGFTGTPLLSNDNITERTFGGYISIYDFKRAVDDGATVPLYYENRGDKIKDLHNPEITDRILDAIEQADLDVDQQDKLEREFAKEIHLLTAEPRLDSIARDFVGHYSDLWTSGKAMFVCLNKVTCVRMYDLVRKYWDKEIEKLEVQIKTTEQQEAKELERKLAWMRETEMAVVISQEQNEIQTFQKWDLDIKAHREKMEKRELDKEFKDAENPLRVVFVCAMWLTGFDVKCLSCLYLDKPLKAHTLMQTIARANRVAEGKSNGLIVDYVGIVKALRKALADYTANVEGGAGTDPTVDKEELIARILDTVAAADAFLGERGFTLQTLVDAKGFAKVELLQTAANAVSASITERKEFQTLANELARLLKYADREDIEPSVRKRCNAIVEIDGQLRKKRRHANNVDLMVQINQIISDYVQIEQPEAGLTESRRFDISHIDFDLLRAEFALAKQRNLVLKDLEDLIQERLEKMVTANPSRINYYERYQKIIDDYNRERDRATIEKTFMELMDLANSMDQEEQRYVREGFESDEELSIYDLLFSENLSKQDIKTIKEVAASLLQKVKAKIAELDHWTDKQETKATIDTLIRDTLWAELPECYDEISISTYRQKIYEYVYTRYPEVA